MVAENVQMYCLIVLEFYWAQIKGVDRTDFLSGESLGKNLFSCLFQLVERDLLHPLASRPCPSLKPTVACGVSLMFYHSDIDSSSSLFCI